MHGGCNDAHIDSDDLARVDQAMPLLEAVTRVNPDLVGPSLNLANIYLAEGRIDQAMALLKPIAQKAPETTALKGRPRRITWQGVNPRHYRVGSRTKTNSLQPRPTKPALSRLSVRPFAR